MKKRSIQQFPIIASLSVLHLHILGYVATLYLPSYSVLIWLLSGSMDIIIILKLIKIIRSTYKAMYTDNLTQLNNRDFFYSSIYELMENLKNEQSCISLLILDLDNFKNINDSCGHFAGDEILKQLSNILKNNIRANDIATRWGGDEFVVTLPGVSKKDAIAIADRIRNKINNHEFVYNDMFFNVTASIGITSVRNEMDITEFINLADKALYKAKANKNTVVFLDA